MMKIWVNLIVLGLLRFVVPVCSNGYSEVKTTLHGMFKDKDFGDSLDILISKYKYTPELIEKSFKRCLEKKVEENKLMACFISGLYREKVLEEHKLLLCIAEYAKDAVVTCIISCLNNYTPECFKCFGNNLERIKTCMDDAPYTYMRSDNVANEWDW